MKTPKTLIEAINYFSDEKVCIDAVAALKWVDGKPVCPKCGAAEGDRKHYWLEAQKRWKCYQCRKQFSVKVGTIFEDSPIALSKWMCALWLLVNCKNGVSSYEIARDLGITQKSAWFVLQRLRFILTDVQTVKMGNHDQPVQMDESYHGGSLRNMHRAKRAKLNAAANGGYPDKTAVFGMLDSKTREVRAMVVPAVKRAALQRIILDNVGFGATVHTDESSVYMGLKWFVHETVNHMQEYVTDSGVHTNSIENFWSLLKRTLQGTYVAVEPMHMDRYLAEATFRFNNRLGQKDGTRFVKALSQSKGRRLTYAELTGKEAASQA